MEKNKFSNGIRIILFACTIMLILVLFQPIWRIELSAPQYPEGLMMNISATGLGGDVAIINGLNHYIGMKTLHNEDFIEFKILPYIIVTFALCFFIVGMVRNRKSLYVLLGSFVLFGTVAMIDFWQWEYNYGHNLDPNAAIIVPGMAYQPPLIGFKQLLNFGAYSVPDIGGWLFILVGILLVLAVFFDLRSIRISKRLNINAVLVTLCLIAASTSGCSTEPEAIKIGSDNCHYCKMTISDNKYGVEVITTKGKLFKYDDPICLFSEISEKGIDAAIIKDIYFTDFSGTHALVKNDKNCFFLKSDGLKAPMGGAIAAFSSHDSLKVYNEQLGGDEVFWAQLISVK
jgi:copper chaperone NosL